MTQNKSQETVLLYAHVHTLAMKALQYAGCMQSNIDIETLKEAASLYEALCSSCEITDMSAIGSKLIRLSRSISLYEELEDNKSLIRQQPVLYYYLSTYRPDKFRTWRDLAEKEMYDLYKDHNALHLYGLMRCDLLTRRKKLPSLPYTINELAALKEYRYFAHLEDLDRFLFTTFVGISNAHICHCISSAVVCGHGNRDREILFVSMPELSANREHAEVLKEFVVKARFLTFNQLLDSDQCGETLAALALYCDRVSILSAGMQISKYRREGSRYVSQYMRLVKPEERFAITTPSLATRIVSKDRPALVLIHCRDGGYKGQAHLRYRDSDIQKLESAVIELGLQKKCCRIGVSKSHLAKNQMIDATRLAFNISESWLFRAASLFISTSSGPGHFASEFYGVSTILVNCTTLVVGDCIRDDKVIALKHIVPRSIKADTEIEFVSSLLNDWKDAPFRFRECTEDEIKNDIQSATSACGLPRLCDLSYKFQIMLGVLSEQVLTVRCANNLLDCLDFVRKKTTCYIGQERGLIKNPLCQERCHPC